MDSVFCRQFICCYRNMPLHCSIKAYSSCQNTIICLHLDIICYLTFSWTKPEINTKGWSPLFSWLIPCLWQHLAMVWFLHFSHRLEPSSLPHIRFPSQTKNKNKKTKSKRWGYKTEAVVHTSNNFQRSIQVNGLTSICTQWKTAGSITTLKIVTASKQGRG